MSRDGEKTSGSAETLVASGLTRRYGERFAVKEVSFTLAGPGAVGLLGRNGAGKTTTLRLCAGWLAADAGRAVVCGRDLATSGPDARAKLGYLAEGAPLYAEMRVGAYLELRARLKGLKTRAKGEVDRVVLRCGLERERNTLCGQLSRGFRQRVGIADALLGEPPLLLFDEPTSGLDPAQVVELRELLRDLALRHALLISTHALAEVEAVCSRVLVMREGALAADCAVDELRARARTFEEALLDLTAADVLPGVVRP